MFYEWLEDAARHQGTAHAVIQRDTYLSFRGLLHRAGRRTEELRALGVEPGTAVGILLGNVSDYVVLAVAASQLGAALVPLAPLASARELALAAAAVPLRAVVSRPGLRALDHDGPRLEGDPRLPAPTKRTRLQGSLLSCALFRAEEQPPLPTDTVLVHLCPTAGNGYLALARSATALRSEAERLAHALGGVDRLRQGVALPLYQPLALEAALALTCGYGAQLFLDDDLAPRAIAQRARDVDPALWLVTRALLWSLASLTPPRALGPASRVLCVDGPVGRDLDQAASRALGVHPEGLLHHPAVGLVSLDGDGKSPATVGVPLPEMEVRLVGPKGTPVPKGRRGALQARALPAQTEAPRPEQRRGGHRASPRPPAGALADANESWVDIGCEAALDPQGRLKVHGLSADCVLVGGQPVSLGEVRSVLLAHGAVEDAEVTLPPSQAPAALDGAALLHARVVTKGPVTPEALLSHLGRHLSPYKVPGQLDLEVARPAPRPAAKRRGR